MAIKKPTNLVTTFAKDEATEGISFPLAAIMRRMSITATEVPPPIFHLSTPLPALAMEYAAGIRPAFAVSSARSILDAPETNTNGLAMNWPHDPCRPFRPQFTPLGGENWQMLR